MFHDIQEQNQGYNIEKDKLKVDIDIANQNCGGQSLLCDTMNESETQSVSREITGA